MPLSESKKWYESITVWAGMGATALGAVVVFLNLFGFNVDPAMAEEGKAAVSSVGDMAQGFVTAVLGLLAWWGRVRATKSIG